MPFSLVAVLLLVLSGMSIALVYPYDNGEEGRMTPETVKALKVASVQACDDISRKAYVAGLEATRSVDVLNASALQERFAERLSSILNDSYPGYVAGSMVCVDSMDLELTVLHAAVGDENGVSSIPAYFSLQGSYRLNVSTTAGHLMWVQEIDEPMYVPLPLLMDRLSRLETSSGVRGDIEATVRYSLSVLAQDRVLRGYGACERDGATGTAAIITEEDVIRAVNIALLLEEMKLFRSPMSAHGVDGSLLAGKEIDAGELLLSTYEDAEYDLRFIAAQAINGAVDRIVIGLMEQLGYLHPVNLMDGLVSVVVSNLNELIQICTKSDLYLEHSINKLKGWAEEAGYEEGWYNPIGWEGPEGEVMLPLTDVVFYDANGHQRILPFFGRPMEFDVQPYDVFSNYLWEDFFDERCADLTIMADHLKGFVRTVADQMSVYADLPVMRDKADPANGVPWTDELLERIRTAFIEQEDWTAPAIEAVEQAGRIQDAASLTTLDFIRDNWIWLTNETFAVQEVAERIAAEECQRISALVPMDESSTRSLHQTLSWMMREEGSYYNNILVNKYEWLSAPFKKAMEAALSARSEELNVADKVIGMVSGRIYGPALQPIAASSALGVIAEVERYLSARYEGGAISLPAEGFVLNGPKGVRLEERLDAEHVGLVAGDGKRGSLSVDVIRPWEQKESEYPCNLHLNDLFQEGILPYSSQWNVSYSGTAVVKAAAPALGSSDKGEMVEYEIPLEGSFSIVTISGWGLVGVDYTPTVTLEKAISDLLSRIWAGILGGAEALGRTIAGAFDTFARLIPEIVSFAIDPLGSMAQALMDLIDKAHEVAGSFLSTILGGLADFAGQVAGGTVIRLSMFGFTLAIIVESGVSNIAGTKDRLTLEMGMELAGLSFSGALRLLKMEEGDHTMVMSATVGKDDWSVKVCADPRTRVYDDLLRATGYFGGMVLDLVLPKVAVVNKVTLSLADIPALGHMLQNIPLIPGVKAAINAGLEVGMMTDGDSTLIINEVEMNPSGKDSGREWIELYNPTDRSIDLTGWSIVTSHGKKATHSLPSRIISPGGHYVHTFPAQALDNGGEGSFATEECAVLVDPNGVKVDCGPWATDHADDARTWQREHDSSSRWVFKEGTPGTANGLSFHGVQDLFGLLDVLRQSFEGALGSREVGDIGDLADLVQTAIRTAADKLISSMLGAITYVQFFVQVGVGDAAGVAEGGFIAALKVTGATLRECLLAMVDNILRLFEDLLNPTNLLRVFQPLGMIGPEDIYVELSEYISISVPSVMGDMFNDLVRAKASVQFNLAAADFLDRRADSGWRIEFGLSAAVGLTIMKVPAGVRSELEAWLVHATLRPA